MLPENGIPSKYDVSEEFFPKRKKMGEEAIWKYVYNNIIDEINVRSRKIMRPVKLNWSWYNLLQPNIRHYYPAGIIECSK